MYAKNYALIVSDLNGNFKGSAFILKNNGVKVVMSAGHVCLGHQELKVGNIKTNIITYRDNWLDYCILDYKDAFNIYPHLDLKINYSEGDYAYGQGFSGKTPELSKYGGGIEGIKPPDLSESVAVCEKNNRCVKVFFHSFGQIINMPIKQGNSGGPIYDNNKEAMGIIIQRTLDNKGIFMPLKVVFLDITSILSGKELYPVTEETEKKFYEEEKRNFCKDMDSFLQIIRFRSYTLICRPKSIIK